MKIEKLGNRKIKVILDADDLNYFNLKPETLTADSAQLHKFLFHIMESVRKETGFNPYSGTVAVEAVHSSGGITLYISSVSGDEKNPEPAEKPKKVKINPEKVHPVRAKKINARNRYCFDDFSALCSALCHIGIGALGVSSIYKYEDKWYFVLGICKTYEETHCVLCEYCTMYGGTLYGETFLAEHGETVATGESLVTMAEGIKKLYAEEVNI